MAGRFLGRLLVAAVPVPAATPSFPLAPMPVGHWTALSAPTLEAQSELSLDSQLVNTNVVPEESARCTTVIFSSGSDALEFRAWMAGSFQFVILPSKIAAAVGPSSFNPWTEML